MKGENVAKILKKREKPTKKEAKERATAKAKEKAILAEKVIAAAKAKHDAKIATAETTAKKTARKIEKLADKANGKKEKQQRRGTKPKIEIDLEKVKEYAALGMSKQDIATALGISVPTLYQRQKDMTDFADAIKKGRAEGGKNYTEALQRLALSEDNPNLGAIIFYLKTRKGWVENPKEFADKNEERNEILEQVRTHKITANEAAIMLDMKDIPIPDSIRMQASKEQPEPEDPTAGAYSSISEEEMAKQHAERMAERDRQRSVWLTERRQDVEQLKEATKDADAFSPEKTGETK